jgi:hypothetical protein
MQVPADEQEEVEVEEESSSQKKTEASGNRDVFFALCLDSGGRFFFIAMYIL